MQRHMPFAAACLIFFACAKTDESGSNGEGGTGQFTVTSSRPTPGDNAAASYSVSVSFTNAAPACATTTIGACTVNPCYMSSSSSGDGAVVLPNTGTVTLLGADMASLGIEPQTDGSYASESVSGELPWPEGGSGVTFQWSHFPGDPGASGDELTLATPPYIALETGSTFAVAGNTVVRSQGLTISWTSDTPPSALDEVAVDVNSGSTQTYCIFNAAAGSGVMPAAVLGFLEAGNGTYSVISKAHAWENINEGDGQWVMNFNVNALARASYGLAKGPVTIQ
jgi:hypothetical protein